MTNIPQMLTEAFPLRTTPIHGTYLDRPHHCPSVILWTAFTLTGISNRSQSRALIQAGPRDNQTHFISGGL